MGLVRFIRVDKLEPVPESIRLELHVNPSTFILFEDVAAGDLGCFYHRLIGLADGEAVLISLDLFHQDVDAAIVIYAYRATVCIVEKFDILAA